MNLVLYLDDDDAPGSLWLDVVWLSEAESVQMLCPAAALGFPPAILAFPDRKPPELAVLLGHREELREVLCLRF